MNRQHEGRAEEILEPDLQIVDTHHHLFERPSGRYMIEDYLDDVGAGHHVVASVYVETRAMERAEGPEILKPLGEVEFVNGVAAMSASGGYGACRVAAGIVAYADLSAGARVAELLDRAVAAAPDRLRGVRVLTNDPPWPELARFYTKAPEAGILQRPGFREGFGELAPRRLSFDAAAFHHQLPDIAELADAFPATTIVLNHCGMALVYGAGAAERAEVEERWAANLRELARRPNVSCKVGGLGLPFWGFGFEKGEGAISSPMLAEAWRPYVERTIEIFGTGRCMVESNYPADSRSAGWVPLWNALKLITATCSAEEKAELYSGTARRVYRLG
ncbi:amidohydrolase family protein [Nocardia sp. CA2R105]|uniref:amidohydrolase family protein n=1 Tax=Nocardia coffeae TaxID=2873381 RepID=UPI001CA62BEE|nr:amidohydrolase family protein [Nocardia coffeae]MBY8858664.1 amidohydrolase family protein [Nocardia coffeae]